MEGLKEKDQLKVTLEAPDPGFELRFILVLLEAFYCSEPILRVGVNGLRSNPQDLLFSPEEFSF